VNDLKEMKAEDSEVHWQAFFLSI